MSRVIIVIFSIIAIIACIPGCSSPEPEQKKQGFVMPSPEEAKRQGEAAAKESPGKANDMKTTPQGNTDKGK